MINSKSFPIPVNYFSIALGLLSLGLGWRSSAIYLGSSPTLGESLLILGELVWLILIGVYLYKWFYRTESAQKELQDIIQCCFISLIPITTILIGIAVLPHSRWLAEVLIACGIAGSMLFAAYRSAGLWRGTHVLEATTPVIYLPTVASSFASASALGALGLPDWGMLFFGAGLFSWLGLEAAILQRLRTGMTLPAPLRGILGIQLAPPFVGCAAYLAVNGGEIDWLVKLLIGYGLLNFLFLVRLLPWILENGFGLSLWAFSFGLGSMTVVGVRLQAVNSNTGLDTLGLFLFWLGTVLIGCLLIETIHVILHGKFFVR